MVKKSKRENREWLKLIDNIFLGLCPSCDSLKTHNILETSFVSVFRQKVCKLLRYAPENKYSPWVVKGKWLLEN